MFFSVFDACFGCELLGEGVMSVDKGDQRGGK